MKVIEAAIGIVVDAHHHVLIAQRPTSKTYSHYWEFPGGKLENNETPEQALIREFQEEVGLLLMKPTFLFETSREYSNRVVKLTIFYCDHYEGNAVGLEQQPIKWVLPATLSDYEFLPANAEIIERLHNSIFLS